MEQWLNEWELLLIAQGTGDYFGDGGDNGPVFVETTPIRRAPPARPNSDDERIDPEIPF
jgi:hypothetical protein